METKHALQVLFETISEHDDEYRVHSYSGRGMHGRECLGVTFRGNIGKLICDVLTRCGVDGEIDDTVPECFENMVQDSMGLGTVVYFPHVKYVDEDSDEECGECGSAGDQRPTFTCHICDRVGEDDEPNSGDNDSPDQLFVDAVNDVSLSEILSKVVS